MKIAATQANPILNIAFGQTIIYGDLNSLESQPDQLKGSSQSFNSNSSSRDSNQNAEILFKQPISPLVQKSLFQPRITPYHLKKPSMIKSENISYSKDYQKNIYQQEFTGTLESHEVSQASNTVFAINADGQTLSMGKMMERIDQLESKIQQMEDQQAYLKVDNQTLANLLQEQDSSLSDIFDYVIKQQKEMESHLLQQQERLESQQQLVQILMQSQNTKGAKDASLIDSGMSGQKKSLRAKRKSITPPVFRLSDKKVTKLGQDQCSPHQNTVAQQYLRTKQMKGDKITNQKQLKIQTDNLSIQLITPNKKQGQASTQLQSIDLVENTIYDHAFVNKTNSSSVELSLDGGINNSPSMRNLDNQRPKLMVYLSKPSLSNTQQVSLKKQSAFYQSSPEGSDQRSHVSCDIEELDMNQSDNEDNKAINENEHFVLAHDGKEDNESQYVDEDIGELKADEIEEKNATKEDRITPQRVNHLKNYQTIQSSRVSTFNKTNTFTNNKLNSPLNLKEILSLKGSKCKCYNFNQQDGRSHKKHLSNSNSKINQSISQTNKSLGLDLQGIKCGTFCKHLTAMEQKHIIKTMMKRQAKLYGIKDPNLVFVNQSNIGYPGEKKYIISSSWWRKWCDYANFGEQMDTSNNYSPNKYNYLSENLDTENNHRSMKTNEINDQSISHLDDRNGYTVYEKPPMIINEALLKSRKSNKLKENLIEHFDYEVVTRDIWNHFYSWYSADWCISRLIKKDKLNDYKIFLDLFPEESYSYSDKEDQNDEFNAY